MSIASARVYATVTGSTATFVASDGHSEPIVSTESNIRRAVILRATEEARRSGSSVELVTDGDRGEHRLLISTDGAIASVIDLDQGGERSPLGFTEADQGEGVREQALRRDKPSEAPAAEPPARTTFIAPGDAKPKRGWRGFLQGLGIAVPPTAKAIRREEAERLVSRHWAGCRTIAVANGKGGVGKTITTAMLAAAYGRYGGGNVLAWDNNDTRGTLGWRTEQGLYDTTIRDLLPAAPSLLAPTASVSDISAYVHHQSADRYDVLRSNPELLAAHQRIAHADFDQLMRVAARYYRLVVFDSGNDESADRWLCMVDSSSQLVIPTLTAPESAESAALLLDALRDRDERSAHLAENAVVVITLDEASARHHAQRIADGFVERVRAVEIVPFDPALKSGALRYDSLRTPTRDAWLNVAAAAASGL